MRRNDRLPMLVFGLMVGAIFTGACRKPADEATRREAAEAELHSAKSSKGTDVNAKTTDETNARFAHVRREQLDLRARLQKEIDHIDEQLATLKVELGATTGAVKDGGKLSNQGRAKDKERIEALLARRRVLEKDANIVDRADEHGWDEVKATIEKDLAGEHPADPKAL